MKPSPSGLAIAALVAAWIGGASSASAGGQPYHMITVTELGGTSEVTVPVRIGESGKEVYIPDRGWEHCRLSCYYTVRLLYLNAYEARIEHNHLGRGLLGRVFSLD